MSCYRIHPSSLLLLACTLFFARGASAQFELDVVIRTSPDQFGLRLLTLPHVLDLEDVADSSLAVPCDLGGGAGDGVINSDDLLCSLWGGGVAADQVGIFMVAGQVRASGPCSHQYHHRRAISLPSGRRFEGEPFPIEAGGAYVLHVPHVEEIGEVEHRFTLTVPCSPPPPLPVVVERCVEEHFRFEMETLVPVPLGSTASTVYELLCGSDWELDEDTREMTCTRAWPTGRIELCDYGRDGRLDCARLQAWGDAALAEHGSQNFTLRPGTALELREWESMPSTATFSFSDAGCR